MSVQIKTDVAAFTTFGEGIVHKKKTSHPSFTADVFRKEQMNLNPLQTRRPTFANKLQLKIQTCCLALLMACLVADLQGDVVQLSPDRFRQLSQEKPGILLDVRTPGEVASGHIEGATAVDIHDSSFEAKIKLMTKGQPVYVYCLSGGRSNAAAKVLSENGFDQVFNLDGGILAWQRARLPLVTAKAAPESGEGTASKAEIQKLLAGPGLVLLDFFAPWCGPCRQMAPIIDRISASYGDRVRVGKIDLSQNQEIAASFEVTSVPSFVLIKHGTVLWKRNGTAAESDFRTVIDSHLKR